MVRAGHSFGLARKIAAMPAGTEVLADELADGARLNEI
jgi:hypothetical protein